MALQRPSIRIGMPSFLLAMVLVVGSAAPTIARDTTGTPGRSAARAIGSATPRVAPSGTRSQAPRSVSRQAELVPVDPPTRAAAAR